APPGSTQSPVTRLKGAANVLSLHRERIACHDLRKLPPSSPAAPRAHARPASVPGPGRARLPLPYRPAVAPGPPGIGGKRPSAGLAARAGQRAAAPPGPAPSAAASAGAALPCLNCAFSAILTGQND